MGKHRIQNVALNEEFGPPAARILFQTRTRRLKIRFQGLLPSFVIPYTLHGPNVTVWGCRFQSGTISSHPWRLMSIFEAFLAFFDICLRIESRVPIPVTCTRFLSLYSFPEASVSLSEMNFGFWPVNGRNSLFSACLKDTGRILRFSYLFFRARSFLYIF
jgi:hypothetical protein